MPTAPMKPCSRPGCGGLTAGRYCDDHQGYGRQKKAAGSRGKKTQPIYGTAAWQRFRDWYKSENPLCEDCLEMGRTVPVYCVDHIIELRDGGEALSKDNARSLCRRCHARKTAAEKRKRNGTS